MHLHRGSPSDRDSLSHLERFGGALEPTVVFAVLEVVLRRRHGKDTGRQSLVVKPPGNFGLYHEDFLVI